MGFRFEFFNLMYTHLWILTIYAENNVNYKKKYEKENVNCISKSTVNRCYITIILISASKIASLKRSPESKLVK